MNQTDIVARTPVAGILGVIGGALLALGSFLAWAEVSGGGTSVTAKGVDGSDGYITLVAGLVAVVAGVVMAKSTRRLLAVLVILAGIVGGGIGLYDALTAKDSVLDAAAEELAPAFGVSAQQVRTVLDQAIDAGQLGVSISIGLYVVIGGGVVALVGGILGLRGSGSLPFLARPRRRQHRRPRSAVRACRLIRCLRRPHHPTQAPSVDAGSSRARGGLALAGGVLAVVGSFLSWAEVSAGPFTEQATGIDGWEGKAALVSGGVMVAAGIRVLAGSHRAMARLWPSAAIGGLVALGVGLYTAVTIRDQLVETLATELPMAEVERAGQRPARAHDRDRPLPGHRRGRPGRRRGAGRPGLPERAGRLVRGRAPWLVESR